MKFKREAVQHFGVQLEKNFISDPESLQAKELPFIPNVATRTVEYRSNFKFIMFLQSRSMTVTLYTLRLKLFR